MRWKKIGPSVFWRNRAQSTSNGSHTRKVPSLLSTPKTNSRFQQSNWCIRKLVWWSAGLVKKGVLNHWLFAVFLPQDVLNNSVSNCSSNCNPPKKCAIVEPVFTGHQYSRTISMMLCRLFDRFSERRAACLWAVTITYRTGTCAARSCWCGFAPSCYGWAQ